MRANADTPEDAARARSFGAEGIGLVRTEHMFFAAERIPIVRDGAVVGVVSRIDLVKAMLSHAAPDAAGGVGELTNNTAPRGLAGRTTNNGGRTTNNGRATVAIYTT